ncbi:SDR family oxidoreductase [Desulfocucumis palustris]|uniref:SDR family oxidoreductase n=1 Tax=Desulfocucumis palustris TaxID=1898651 RepID=UPI000CE9D1BD|nr:SDR family oxidoreductase [Desulfocucumis palustris]
MRHIRELLDLTGQVAIVTGGATGIGRQMAYALGEAGADLVIAARNLERCQEVARQMAEELRVRVLPVALDLRKSQMIDALYDLVMKEFGRVEILINNSGTTWGAPTFELPLNGWNKVIETNLTGAWLMAQKAGQIMSKQNYGRIINIASYLAFVGTYAEYMDAVPYPVSKAALLGLTRDLAVKWAKYNITVNAIAPGWFPSQLSDKNKELHEEISKHLIPMHRLGSDDELKTGVLFLASPGSSYCTGITLSIDGGLLAV